MVSIRSYRQHLLPPEPLPALPPIPRRRGPLPPRQVRAFPSLKVSSRLRSVCDQIRRRPFAPPLPPIIRALHKRGFVDQSTRHLGSAAAPWNRPIYALRTALALPLLADSPRDLALRYGSNEKRRSWEFHVNGWQSDASDPPSLVLSIVNPAGPISTSCWTVTRASPTAPTAQRTWTSRTWPCSGTSSHSCPSPLPVRALGSDLP